MVNPQTFNELMVNIKSIDEIIENKQEQDEYKTQIQLILHNLLDCLNSVEKKYLTNSIIEDANRNVKNIKSNIQIGHWSLNDSFLGEIVKVIAYLNNCNGKPALRGYNSAVKKNISILENQTQQLKENIVSLSENAKEKTGEIKEEADRFMLSVKEKIKECEDHFSKLQNNYTAYENEIKEDLDLLKENNKQEKVLFEQSRKETLESIEEKMKIMVSDFEMKQKNKLDELQKEKEDAISQLTEELNDYKNQREQEIKVIKDKAVEQLNIISNATYCDAYNKQANKAAKLAVMWYVFTMLSLGALIAVSVFWFIKADYTTTNYISLIAKALGTVSVATIARYCAIQASKNKTLSTKLRKIELQMLSFDAFVATLPEQTQIELKTELTKLFINQKDWLDHDKDEMDIIKDYNKLLKRMGLNKGQKIKGDDTNSNSNQ